jgi:hypothetical protein
MELPTAYEDVAGVQHPEGGYRGLSNRRHLQGASAMFRRHFVEHCLAMAILVIDVGSVAAQDTVKIGVVFL